MTHAMRARKERGAKIAAVDIYQNGTMEQADLPVLIRPGTDGALACAVMHCLFRDGHADWDYLDRYTDAPRELAEHLAPRTPQWAAAITGCDAGRSRLSRASSARRKRAYFRLGYGFSRSRNGAANMHAAMLHPRRHRRLAARGRRRVPQQRRHLSLEQDDDRGARRARSARSACSTSRASAPILCGEPRCAGRRAAGHGDADPEHQSGLGRARAGEGQARLRPRRPVRLRPRAVHDRDRARWPTSCCRRRCSSSTTTSIRAAATRYIILGPKLVEPPGECRSNHEVIGGLAERARREHPGFAMTPRELIDWMLRHSGWGTLAELEAKRWIDCQPDFAPRTTSMASRYPDGKFRFKPDWPNVPFRSPLAGRGRSATMPKLPDHWAVDRGGRRRRIRSASPPRRRAASSTRPSTRRRRRGRRKARPDGDDPSRTTRRDLGIADGAQVVLGNDARRGDASRAAVRGRAPRRR